MIDDDGFIHITGRLSRFSKIGGEMVPHIHVEELLQRIIADDDEKLAVAVTAVPDERKGERLIVLHLPYRQDRPSRSSRSCPPTGLPNLWIPSPDSFFEVEQIPVLGTGKLDLQAVRELAQDKAVGSRRLDVRPRASRRREPAAVGSFARRATTSASASRAQRPASWTTLATASRSRAFLPTSSDSSAKLSRTSGSMFVNLSGQAAACPPGLASAVRETVAKNAGRLDEVVIGRAVHQRLQRLGQQFHARMIDLNERIHAAGDVIPAVGFLHVPALEHQARTWPAPAG